jgi:hypothetical protein
MIVNKASSSRGYHPANPPAGEKHTAGTGTQFFRLFGKNASRQDALLRILLAVHTKAQTTAGTTKV